MTRLLASSALALSLALLAGGCPPPAPPAAPPAPVTSAADGKVPAAAWCAEHGVPEAVCTRCDASLIEGFKAKQDWCAEHALPESQCVACNPQVEAKWKAMAPAAAPR